MDDLICPKCGERTEKVYVKQKFSMVADGEMDKTGKINYPDWDKGHTDGWEWADSMLSEEGKPEIVGCPKCL